MHVRIYNGPCPDGYIRGRDDPIVWGIFYGLEPVPIHVIQHPNPGPAMDWARMFSWQLSGKAA